MVEALTVERAGELLAGLLPAPGPVRSVSRFAEGSVTGAYRIEFAGPDPAPVVLKVYDAGSRRFAVKEARALRFLTGHGLDISPRVLAFSRSAGPLGGRPCLVSSLRPGRTLADLDAELTGAQRREVYRQLGAVLKRLHAIPAGGYGDFNGQIRDPLPCNSAYLARLLERDLRRFRRNAADPALAGQLAAYLTRHARARSRALHLVHDQRAASRAARHPPRTARSPGRGCCGALAGPEAAADPDTVRPPARATRPRPSSAQASACAVPWPRPRRRGRGR